MDDADALMGRIVDSSVAAMEMATLVLGSRLGLWRQLADAPDGLTSSELSSRANIAPRYCREWCEAMGASGFLQVRPGAGDEPPVFVMSDAAREVLLEPESERYIEPLARQVIGALAAMRRLEDAYRDGTGFGWTHHDPDVREGEADLNRFALRRMLPGWIDDTLPEVARRLIHGARVADIGCGHGWAGIGIAETFDAIVVDSYDLDGESIDAARTNIAAAGLSNRVRPHLSPLDRTDGPFDLIVLAEMLHDVPDPVGLLATCRRTLAPNGSILVVDMKVADDYRAPADLVERMMYGFSVLICLPDSMALLPSAATGTVLRPATLRHYAERAGLVASEPLAIEHETWRFWRLQPA
ncbi:methyltransferase domain-containing protein [Jatrophihabitans telluris]|uniref:Methyltransferase domain-containing protein n=1 Tax=Jatrophihabitans telluris TaxID=2038343 RepID=A0ABY4QVD6_9ACTN|nr:class I SAM-dependent methyltransferase [Jatrophihabitans telluris]UQX86836.1 methyltransferase domain-containing protein [Jatrophihabitans telluris]